MSPKVFWVEGFLNTQIVLKGGRWVLLLLTLHYVVQGARHASTNSSGGLAATEAQRGWATVVRPMRGSPATIAVYYEHDVPADAWGCSGATYGGAGGGLALSTAGPLLRNLAQVSAQPAAARAYLRMSTDTRQGKAKTR